MDVREFLGRVKRKPVGSQRGILRDFKAFKIVSRGFRGFQGLSGAPVEFKKVSGSQVFFKLFKSASVNFRGFQEVFSRVGGKLQSVTDPV